jgi:hypothetical protein
MLADHNRQYLEEANTANFQHPEVLYPLLLKKGDYLDPNRIVLYREDCREVPYILSEADNHFEPVTAPFIIEISRTKNHVYILAVKIPEKLVLSILNGKRQALTVSTHP